MSAFRPHRMKFGAFLAPFHRIGENPTLALRRDIDFCVKLDQLGFDEVWIGEHHSAGWETVGSPELMIAAAAERTQSIRLGTGVVSLPYHHPFMVAERMLQLDHMTRGRTMLGVGPGAITSDAHMLGLDALKLRERMDESLGAIIALLRGEVVTQKTDWFELREARLQLGSFTHPHIPISVASTVSPAGPTVAGKYGTGILSVAAYAPGGLQSLRNTWEIAEESAGRSGNTLNREDWRLVIPIHLADTQKEAVRHVEESYYNFQTIYNASTIGRTLAGSDGQQYTVQAAIERGGAIIGTPETAIEAVEAIIEMSGGFGGLLGLAHEWATPEQSARSHELWARYVAPHFQNQIDPLRRSRDWVASRMAELIDPNTVAIGKAFTDAGMPIPEKIRQRLDRTSS